LKGIVKYFNIKKHFGFIFAQGKDYFVHAWDIKEKSKLKKGDRVSFKVEKASKDFRAVEVKRIT